MSKKFWISVALMVSALSSASGDLAPVLQASIKIAPAYAREDKPELLQPGMPALLKTVVKNTGGLPSQEGEVFIRFALPKPLARMGKGMMFETEKEPLRSLQAGEELEIAFKTPQQLPGLAEFLKNDWPMHIYEAVVRFGQEEFVVGSGTITFSAHYYPGPNKPQPTPVPPLAMYKS